MRLAPRTPAEAIKNLNELREHVFEGNPEGWFNADEVIEILNSVDPDTVPLGLKDADWQLIRDAREGYEQHGWKDDPDTSKGWIIAAHLANRLAELHPPR